MYIHRYVLLLLTIIFITFFIQATTAQDFTFYDYDDNAIVRLEKHGYTLRLWGVTFDDEVPDWQNLITFEKPECAKFEYEAEGLELWQSLLL